VVSQVEFSILTDVRFGSILTVDRLLMGAPRVVRARKKMTSRDHVIRRLIQVLLIDALFVLNVPAVADESAMLVLDPKLARALAFGHILLDERSVRVIAVPEEIGECGGAINSCPDVNLFVAYVSGDLGDEPVVYRLPAAKGWRVIGWADNDSIDLQTALPEANIEPAEREAWSPVSYRLTVGYQTLKVQRK